MHSKLLYAAPVWVGSLQTHTIQRRLFSAQKSAALKIVSVYRTVSTNALSVLARVTPINLLTEEKAGDLANML